MPGPDLVYKCPHCGDFLITGSLLSGNTFGSILYSDGKQYAPMLPTFPDLTVCRNCDRFLRLSDSEEVASLDFVEINETKWATAQRADFLSIADCSRALDSGYPKDREEEIEIRRLMWWTYNDRVRDGKELFTNQEDESRWKENLLQFLKILDPSDTEQLIMMAEIYRNLGEFDRSVSTINKLQNEELYFIRDILLIECKKRNSSVVELNPDLFW